MRVGKPTGAGLRISLYTASMDVETDPENPTYCRGESVAVDLNNIALSEPTLQPRAAGWDTVYPPELVA
jgi:hypothetical protein